MKNETGRKTVCRVYLLSVSHQRVCANNRSQTNIIRVHISASSTKQRGPSSSLRKLDHGQEGRSPSKRTSWEGRTSPRSTPSFLIPKRSSKRAMNHVIISFSLFFSFWWAQHAMCFGDKTTKRDREKGERGNTAKKESDQRIRGSEDQRIRGSEDQN